jgi:hypothetical protein
MPPFDSAANAEASVNKAAAELTGVSGRIGSRRLPSSTGQ